MTDYQQEAPPDVNDVLMGGGAPTFKFENPGDQVGGTIAETRSTPERQWNQQTQRSDGPVKTFPSGATIYQIEVILQTGLQDPADEDDDGQRRIFIAGKRAKNALRDAIRAAGADKILPGGYLAAVFAGYDPNSFEGKAKDWQFTYQPPAPSQGNGQPPQPQQVQQPQQAQPAPQGNGQPQVQVPQPQQVNGNGQPQVQVPQPQQVNGNGQPQVQVPQPQQAPQPQQGPQPQQAQPANGNGQPQVQVPQPQQAPQPQQVNGNGQPQGNGGQPAYDPNYVAQVQAAMAQPGQSG